MFQDTLLESSSIAPARKRWPMAAAFLLETLVAGVLVAVPLLSTGIIPVFSAYGRSIPPRQSIQIAARQAKTHPSPGNPGAHTTSVEVVTINNAHTLHIGAPRQINNEIPCPLCPDATTRFETGRLPDGLDDSGNSTPSLGSPKKRLRFSELSQAMLVHKVEPAYPRIAQLSGISGVVKLHAIIGKDGSVQSLSLISGHPILATAALEAVAQWRYRPYLLNGEPVEVETFITVNFRKAGR